MEVLENRGATPVKQCAVSHGLQKKFVQKFVQSGSGQALFWHLRKKVETGSVAQPAYRCIGKAIRGLADRTLFKFPVVTKPDRRGMTFERAPVASYTL